MFTVTLTDYGQSQISSLVIIDGIVLLYDYIADISSVSSLSGYTVQLDEEACGNLKNNVGNVFIRDLSSSEYQAKTILFYRVVDSNKRILGGYSQSAPILQKNTDILSLYLSLDFSAFTNGFLFSSIQAGYSTASHNTDGLLHIENPGIQSDDDYSVYSKTQTDALAAQTVKDAHYFVKGTQSTSTYAWTGNIGVSALYDGLVINYFLPFAGVSSSYAQLTLTLANGTTTSAIPVYYRTSSRCTTQFPVGSIIQMTYMENVVIGSTTIAAGWFANVSYAPTDTNYYDRLRLNNSVYASTNGIFAYTIILRTGENTYTSVCSSSSTAADKSPTQDEFYLDSILYYGNNIDVASGNATSTLAVYRANDVATSRSVNASSLTASQPLYLRVLYHSATNKFYFDQSVDWWTQSLPNSYDGYYYVYIGSMYSTTTLTFDVNHPIYTYIAGVGIREVSSEYSSDLYVTLNTEQSIAADKYISDGNTLYFSSDGQSNASDNNVNIVSGQLTFCDGSDTTNTASSLQASTSENNTLELSGNLVPDSAYNLGSTSNKWESIYANHFRGGNITVNYGRCSTAANVVNKIIECPNFVLEDGALIFVSFANTNSASNPTVQIKYGPEDTDLTPVKYLNSFGSNHIGPQAYIAWRTGGTIGIIYDAINDYFMWIGFHYYCYGCQTTSYSTNVGPSNNSIATYSYSSATDRAFRPSVNYSSSAYVDLGRATYKWGTLFTHQIGTSTDTIDSGYIDYIHSDTVSASYLGESGDPIGNAFITQLYSDYIGDTDAYVTEAYITDAYITNIHGTVDSCTYAQYVGSTSTNSVATYSYSSATVRSFRPVVNYSTSAYVNLGSPSYKWGYVYANYIGSSSYKVATVYATNLGTSSYYVSNTYSTNVYATNLGSASGSSISNAYIDYLSATTIGATNNRVANGYFTNLSATSIGSSTSTVTEAYIDYMTGTASYAEEAGKAVQDSKGSTIYTTYIADISTSTSSSSTTVYNTTAGGTTSSTVAIPTSNLLLKNNNSAATKYTRSIAAAVAGTISNSDDVGMIRLVAFKTTATWTKKTTDIYISGSLLRPVDLRTENNDTSCVLRINAETTLNNSAYSGTWRVLHKIGNISSGNMFVALAIRIA